jgi:hypothetical protein
LYSFRTLGGANRPDRARAISSASSAASVRFCVTRVPDADDPPAYRQRLRRPLRSILRRHPDGRRPRLLEVRKVMSARHRFPYTLGHEKQGLTRGVGTPSPSRRRTRLGGIFDRGGRRVPRRRSPLGTAMGRRIPAGRRVGPGRPARVGSAAEIDARAGEVHPPMAGRQADRTRLPDRPLDRAEGGPHDPPGVRRRDQPEVHGRLASRARVYPAEAPAGPSPARPGSERRVVGRRLAAHQKKPGGSTPTSS